MNSQPLTDLDIGFVGVHELIEKGPGIHEPNPVGLEPNRGQQKSKVLGPNRTDRFPTGSWIPGKDQQQFVAGPIL